MAIKHDWISNIAPTTDLEGRRRALGAAEQAARPEQLATHPGYKDVLDRSLAAIGLVLFLPALALLGLLIKLTSPGPILHRQERVGKDGLIFRIVKLRTMVADAERATGPVWASPNDPRITPIGRFLRKTHLDEVPQLWNVLLGHMSIVGPRPERPVFVEQFNRLIPNYGERLRVKPGITGLAQINHRYDSTIQDVRAKLAYDFLYMRKMCLKTDLMIVLLTAPCLTGRLARWQPETSSPDDGGGARPSIATQTGQASMH